MVSMWSAGKRGPKVNGFTGIANGQRLVDSISLAENNDWVPSVQLPAKPSDWRLKQSRPLTDGRFNEQSDEGLVLLDM